MNGPQNYTQAQRLLASVTFEGTHPDGSPIIREGETDTLLAAIGHALLGLTAATAISTLDRTGWISAIFGTRPGGPGTPRDPGPGTS